MNLKAAVAVVALLILGSSCGPGPQPPTTTLPYGKVAPTSVAPGTPEVCQQLAAAILSADLPTVLSGLLTGDPDAETAAEQLTANLDEISSGDEALGSQLAGAASAVHAARMSPNEMTVEEVGNAFADLGEAAQPICGFGVG